MACRLVHKWILAGIILVTPFAAAAEDLKFGYVDLERAMQETEEGKKALSGLKKDFEQKQKELDEQQEQMKKAVEDLEKKRTLLPAETVRQKERELQEQMGKVQQTYMRHQQALQKKEAEATSKIVQRFEAILDKMAKAENFSMIIDRKRGGVVYAKPHLDLTNELIRRFNAGEGKGAGAPAAGKKAPAAPTK